MGRIKTAAFSVSRRWRCRSSCPILSLWMSLKRTDRKMEVAGIKKKRGLALWAPFAGGAACKAGAGPPKTQDTVSRGFVIADVSLCQL